MKNQVSITFAMAHVIVTAPIYHKSTQTIEYFLFVKSLKHELQQSTPLQH